MRANLKTNPLIPAEKEAPSTIEGQLDMVIAFDTTGSMSSYISNVKRHVKTLIPKLFAANPNLRIGIVAFGDYCDMRNKDTFGKAYQVQPLTSNENNLIKFVTEAQNTGGGDGDEFYELVIKKIVEETDWRPTAKKSVLLIADANPHKIGYNYKDYVVNNQIDWKKEAKKAAALGIQFDTLAIRLDKDWYKELSDITNGVYAPFSSSNKTIEIVETASYSRGGKVTLEAFECKMSSYVASGDTELTAMANAYSKKLTEDDFTINITDSTSISSSTDI